MEIEKNVQLFGAECLVKVLRSVNVFVGSQRNVSTLTLDGVDVMGERLAGEVRYHLDFMNSTNFKDIF